MSANKPDIQQLRKYLNGELDARAMHQVERALHEDPLLWDVLKGMESDGTDHDANLTDIDHLIDERVQDRKRIIPLWTIISVAASLLIVLGVGGWLLTRQPERSFVAANTVKKAGTPAKIDQEGRRADTKPATLITRQPALANADVNKIRKPVLPSDNNAKPTSTLAAVNFKTDTVEYKASAYNVRRNGSVDELLKKMPGFEVDSSGTVTHQGQAISKVKINGKGYLGGDANAATKNLPADIIDKIQVVDDYGDQAARSGIKDGNPQKVLNITVKNNGLIAGNVTDKSGKPVPYAMVAVKGTQMHTFTDIYGDFKIAAKPNAELSVSSIGYIAQQVPVKNKDKLNIALTDNTKALAAVNITGYAQSSRKSESSASSTTISGRDIILDTLRTQMLKQSTMGNAAHKAKELPQINAPEQALQGRLAGVVVRGGGSAKNVSRTITGVVIDKEDHSPLPGVAIRLSGGQIGTTTDAAGKFTLTVPAKTETIDVLYIGYTTQHVKLKDQTDLKIELTANTQMLSEVMVTTTDGYTPPPVIYDAHPRISWDEYDSYIKENATMPDGKTGVVRLAITIAADGSISNVVVKKGIRADMDQKAIDLVKNGPKWVPNRNGKPQVVRLRVRFR